MPQRKEIDPIPPTLQTDPKKAGGNGFILVDGVWDWDNSYGPQKWNIHFQYEHDHSFVPIEYELDSGWHTLYIAVRSTHFVMDEFYIFNNDTWSHWDLQERNYLVSDDIMEQVSDTTGTFIPFDDNPQEPELPEEPDVEMPLSLGDEQLDILEIYPNPTSQSFTIKNLSRGDKLLIYDHAGKEVRSFAYGSETDDFDVSSLGNGIYYVKTKYAVLKLIKK